MKTFFVSQFHFFQQIGTMLYQVPNTSEEEFVKEVNEFPANGRIALYDAFIVQVTLDDNELVTGLATKHLMRDEKRVDEVWVGIDKFDFDCFDDGSGETMAWASDKERDQPQQTIFVAKLGEKLSYQHSRKWVKYYHAVFRSADGNGMTWGPDRKWWIQAYNDGRKETSTSKKWTTFKVEPNQQFEKVAG